MARVPFRLYRAAQGIGVALCLALAACSGGGDATAPDPNPDPGQHPAPNPDPNPNPQPNPNPDEGTLVGSYGLVSINDSKPGQMVLLSNPDGKAIGLYRFDAATTVSFDALGGYKLDVKLQDDKNNYEFYDEGDFKWHMQDNVIALTFESNRDGRTYQGFANPQAAVLKYDTDGDGTPDTVLGFARIGG
jgi:hypothetical protein